MDPTEELYCVRWKGRVKMVSCVCKFTGIISGFHSNIVSALEDLKSDESFVDVTLSCEGEMIQVRQILKSFQ